MTAQAQRTLSPTPSQETITGTITSVRFYNPRNGWAVLSIHSGGEQIAAVGSVVNPREGDEYQLTGSWAVDAKYGRQFKIQSAEVLLPSTRKGVIRYLASIAHGVGEVKAARIVGALGDDCLTRLAADAEALRICNFLTELQQQEILAHLREHSTVAEVSGIICKEGITPALAAKVVAFFGEGALSIVKEEPYRLTELDGIGFLTADKVALSVGIVPTAPQRIQAAILHILSEAENDGHCYLRPNDLVREVPALLGADISISMVAEAVSVLIASEMLIRDGDDIYTAEMHEAETHVARMVRTLAAQEPAKPTNLEGLIDACQTNANLSYHPKQRDAIRMALTSGFSVLSGGPGTGKTLVTKAIVEIYRKEHHTLPVYLCSPTGRAAKRLSEATGYPAKTIHRLLGYIPGVGFSHHEEELLDGGLLIADEFSMCDVRLAESLLAACANGMQVILVGDVDQLPSVGPGSVLRDIIGSGAVPVTMLEYVYRQEEGSGISALASQINQGIVPSLAADTDVTAIQIQNPDEAAPLVVEYANKAYEQYGLMGFGVLAPMHKGSSGVKALNQAIRDAINPGAGNRHFWIGDKVMVTKNDYKHDIFNGDLGVIRDVKGGVMQVDFGDKWVEFGSEEDCADPALLQLAFASTVHKMQGSELPVCIVVLTRQHYIMLARNLLYTAITRAKNHLVIVYQKGALKQAISNNKIAQRNSRLAIRLRSGGAPSA